MTPLETGERIANRYVLLRRIGDGGHAQIWLARDADDSQIALKFPHASNLTVAQLLDVLRHESRMAAALPHPQVLRLGEPQQDGERVFLPMDYAPGGDLSSLRGASYQRIVPVLLQVAAILAAAHEHGLVHRDIKPGNVLFDANGTPRLTDFGTSAWIGTTGSLAPGSPFTASPQQLCGEPAQPADDIYGLGALAYELLSGYPPFFPDFDLARVISEMPPAPRPTQAAPPRLVHLVMDMLARAPADRPASMREVIRVLEEALSDTLEAATDVTLIEEAAVPARPHAPARRRLSIWAVLALAAVAVAGLLWLWLSKHGDGGPQAPQAQLEALPGEAALEPAAAQGLDRAIDEIGAAERSQVQAFRNEIGTGQRALARGQPGAARLAFERAARIQPGAPEVKNGLVAAARLENVLALHSSGLKAETAGDRRAALADFEAALKLEPGFAPAREGQQRINSELQRQQREAAQLSAQRERDAANARDEKLGRELEAAERWGDALTLYKAVLDRDVSLDFARRGVARASERELLDSRLQDFVARPNRLSTPQVRHEAERALLAARAIQPQPPRLEQQTGALTQLLGDMDVEARVQITSDNSTHVSIHRVGDLGVFSIRELGLRPGSYTVIGTRSGFRDVRHELRIAPGQRSVTLSVECTERI